MDSKVNYRAVGAFVILLTAATIFAIIWLSAGLTMKKYNIYEVFISESVNGLNIDSPVKYNGVTVGKIKEMKLRPDDPKIVDLLIYVEEGTPITRSTVATITSQGLTGVSYLDLQTKGSDIRPLLRESGQRYPVIPVTPSLFFRLDKAITQLIDDFHQVSSSISSTLDPENRAAIKRTFSNLDKITTDLAGEGTKIKEIIDNTATATRKLPHFFKEGHSTFHNINKQTIPKVHEILSGVQNVTNNLTGATRSIKDNPAVLLRGQQPRAPGPGER